VVLPAPSTVTEPLVLHRLDATLNVVNVEAAGGALVNGETSVPLSPELGMMLQPVGDEYVVILEPVLTLPIQAVVQDATGQPKVAQAGARTLLVDSTAASTVLSLQPPEPLGPGELPSDHSITVQRIDAATGNGLSVEVLGGALIGESASVTLAAGEGIVLEPDGDRYVVARELRHLGTQIAAVQAVRAAEQADLDQANADQDALLDGQYTALAPVLATKVRQMSRLALLDWSIRARRRAPGSLHTRLTGLVDAPRCAGDVMIDQVLWRYFSAVSVST
jgi:hypothetical protein